MKVSSLQLHQILTNFRNASTDTICNKITTSKYLAAHQTRCEILTSAFEYKLDGHGKARREAARRRKSEWKVNLGN